MCNHLKKRQQALCSYGCAKSYSGNRRYLSLLISGRKVSHSNCFRICVTNSLLVAELAAIISWEQETKVKLGL